MIYEKRNAFPVSRKVELSRRRVWNAGDGTGADGDESSSSTPSLQTVPKSEYDALLAKYNGLQGHAQKMKSERDNFERQISMVTQDYESKITSLIGERDSASQELESLRGENTTLASKIEGLERDRKVGSMIADKYPGLAGAHAKGLLNTNGFDEESLSTYLEAWNETLSGIQKQGAREMLKGTTPNAPKDAQQVSKTAQQLLEDMDRFTPGSNEYQQAEEAYIAALQNQKS